ncbi:MAG: mechanosensitive ion channel domain-containing protein [Crocinitomicaceae bacterium]
MGLKDFQAYQTEIIQTLLIILILFILRIVMKKVIKKRISVFSFSPNRVSIAMRTITAILLVVAVVAITSVWSLDPSEVILFASSTLTVLGVAFFAQWSHLSNITAGVIIFFNSSTKIGDTITILDKEFNISGEIIAIEAMFIKIKTEEGEIISLPNNIVLQKPIRIKAGSKIKTS